MSNFPLLDLGPLHWFFHDHIFVVLEVDVLAVFVGIVVIAYDFIHYI